MIPGGLETKKMNEERNSIIRNDFLIQLPWWWVFIRYKYLKYPIYYPAFTVDCSKEIGTNLTIWMKRSTILHKNMKFQTVFQILHFDSTRDFDIQEWSSRRTRRDANNDFTRRNRNRYSIDSAAQCTQWTKIDIELLSMKRNGGKGK